MAKRWPLASFFFIQIANILASAMAQSWCFKNGNYTNSSAYKSNLDTLLSSLSSNVDYNGFYNASMGQNPDTVYASVLCRGDVQLLACRTCIQDATTAIVRSCPSYKQAVQFNEFCTLRYSNESMFGLLADMTIAVLYNTQNASSPDQFMLDVTVLEDDLLEQAANGGSLRKVAAGNRSTVNSQIVFSLIQCTPDLSVEDCRKCLTEAASDNRLTYCNSKIGCRILKPSCNLRYEVVPFYNQTRLQELQPLTTPPLQPLSPPPGPPASSSPPPPGPLPSLPPPPGPRSVSSGTKDKNKTRTTIIIVVSISIGVFLILAIFAGILLMRTNKKPPQVVEPAHGIIVSESLQYDFGEIKAATDDFSDASKLGQGGFGVVYKGKLSNGQEIAVKRLSIDSGQGDAEFKNEVLLVAKLRHRNLVRLLGYSMKGNEKLLVYEFVKNASLDKFLFDPVKRRELDWERRYKIIGGISRALVYLHEESRLKIIHRDLKASNILLDADMNPKIADFGMARLCAANETQGNTNRIVGTYGYMSPEYAMHGQFSVKSDVFSFGVLLLEILTGQKNNYFQNGETIEDLLSVAWKYWHQRTIEDIIDPILRSSLGSLRDIVRYIHIGLLCVQDSPAHRPTMASVVLMLSNFTISLPVPSVPMFFTTSDNISKNALFQTYDSKEIGSTTSSSQNKSPYSTESSRNARSIIEFHSR